LSTFQAHPSKPETGKSYTVRTKAELSALFANADFAAAREIQLVEVIMDKFDAPRSMRNQAQESEKAKVYGD